MCCGHFCVSTENFNPLNAELNPICHLIALLGGATIVVVGRLRVNVWKKLSRDTFTIYIYICPFCFFTKNSHWSLIHCNIHVPKLNFQGCTSLACNFYSLEGWYLGLYKTVLYRMFLKFCEFIDFYSFFFLGIQVFYDTTSGRFNSGCRRFEGTYRFLFQGSGGSWRRTQKTWCFHKICLLVICSNFT